MIGRLEGPQQFELNTFLGVFGGVVSLETD